MFFIRYGVMHRNTFINSTKLLKPSLNLKSNENIYFAGQITGSEGYVAAMATGMMAAINISNRFDGKEEFVLDDRSATGAIIKYITEEKKDFQPIGPNFGIVRSLEGKRIKDKRDRYIEVARIALEYLDEKLDELEKKI